MVVDILNDITNYINSKASSGVKDVYMYAHNAGNFDLKIILKSLYKAHKSQTAELPVHISDPNHDIYQISIK